MKRTSLRWTFFVTLLLFAVPLYADQAVNINTADKAVLMTLTGIGEVKAQAIIDYRNANGPFSKIEDIMNVSGIGTATFNNIKDHITVESISVPNTTEPQVQETQPPLQIQPEQGGGAAPTPRLAVRITGENRSIVGAGSFWGGEAYGIDDEPLGQGIRYLWNFGDGATVEGRRVFHAYAYPGKYAVLLTVAQGYSSASNLIAVEAVLGNIIFAAEGDGSLTVYNKSDQNINIGLWSLVQGAEAFVIPENTFVLAGEGVRFSPLVTKIVGTLDADLLYPNGMQAMSATVGGNSPLRGERVSAPPKSASSGYADLPAGKSAEVLAPPLGKPHPSVISPQPSESVAFSEENTAAAAKNDVSSSLWLSLAGLALVIAVGVAGTWYARPSYAKTTEGGSSGLETALTADEFEITTQ
ncbi:hypothetical protein A2852_00500 [Candidatus Adlerbacteria bacterium RIFCSPHIGHO2_01_FULL_54_23]|uniref:PKD domain-containing protein n=3 Tax=Candidatus Adleribacteriota TaxID=1752736 RepID=A0A1F4Y0L2_9BACT|nr:MAG: uptake protein [Candidatus Adlerbacteria bacterium GW2011_GWA1_54_10]KKW37503.1 MAG: uptake protein [Candidatus Adlerbacteria bacterium GW2011_GWB1_54_7]OGC79306.1 MAG: hypothetical protein A2852_00500 [Candidatus Adlerbacteria bacterium RIFCSPHIGHO2_01_FULL_54_23]OGC87336.1 MAG: hypothetical protein A3B33_00085 [Candidatus Adlerbacteria bacterium RIFCSPLOWO2_01_FULL_54_16]